MNKQGVLAAALLLAALGIYFAIQAHPVTAVLLEPATTATPQPRPERPIETHHRLAKLSTEEAPRTVYSGYSLPDRTHPYAELSDEALLDMSVSDPDSAVLLARRLDDDKAALQLYERATVLSGSPDPMFEWMFSRQSRATAIAGGELEDIESTKVAYEIALAASKLEPWVGVERLEKLLMEEGVDLEPIRHRAQQRFARLTAERRAVLAEGWPS